jgi:hypothetical protein
MIQIKVPFQVHDARWNDRFVTEGSAVNILGAQCGFSNLRDIRNVSWQYRNARLHRKYLAAIRLELFNQPSHETNNMSNILGYIKIRI